MHFLVTTAVILIFKYTCQKINQPEWPYGMPLPAIYYSTYTAFFGDYKVHYQ